MDFPPLFEGPAGTLFLLEGTQLRILSAEGEEALVALVDFVALLLHLTGHSVLGSAQWTSGLNVRLAALLS